VTAAALLFALGAKPAAAQVVGATVLVENAPEGIAANPTTRRIYVANSGSGSVSVIDAVRNVAIGTIKVGTNPRRIALNAATNRLYVANQGSSNVSVIDGERNVVEATIPTGDAPGAIAVNPTTNRVYVANCAKNQVVVIDGAANAAVGAIATPSCTKEVLINEKTNRVYLINADGTIGLVDGTRDVAGDTTLPRDLGNVTGAALNSSNNRAYLAQQDKNALGIIDGATGAALEPIAVPSPDAVAVNPTNNRIYVTSAAGGTVTVIDGAANKVLSTIPVAGKALGIAVNPTTGRAYPSLQDRNAISVIGVDFIAPAVATTIAPEPTPSGWNAADVTVTLKATDNQGGSGVKELGLVTTGAQPTPLQTVAGDTATFKVTQDGPTILVFGATDAEGNAGIERAIIVFVDKSAPKATISPDDGTWHKEDVNIPVTATDFGSGLANAGDASFNLVATLPAGEEKADVESNSREIADVAGNKTTVGPVKGIKIDRKPPAINVTAPTQRVFILRQPVVTEVACTDGGSGVESCTATGLKDNRLDTTAVGAKSFGVVGKDKAGNEATLAVNYTVAYDVLALHDPNTPVSSGKKIVLRLQLRDAAGVNVSLPNTTLTALRLDGVTASGTTRTPINRLFSFVAGGAGKSEYQFVVDTTGLNPGRYVVSFTAGKEPFLYPAPFMVR
jgi:YVTN family beta-propeller protein